MATDKHVIQYFPDFARLRLQEDLVKVSKLASDFTCKEHIMYRKSSREERWIMLRLFEP